MKRKIPLIKPINVSDSEKLRPFDEVYGYEGGGCGNCNTQIAFCNPCTVDSQQTCLPCSGGAYTCPCNASGDHLCISCLQIEHDCGEIRAF